jgi:uncharacterized protein YyaL (SSP411 family)
MAHRKLASLRNMLSLERSPYLRHHASNPVAWQPWSREAIDIARDAHVPLLVSSGYTTCHWCHVMAHESFEDAELASYLNSNFVCIKVDREERPQLDDYLMTYCQASTGNGGWPLNVFLGLAEDTYVHGVSSSV